MTEKDLPTIARRGWTGADARRVFERSVAIFLMALVLPVSVQGHSDRSIGWRSATESELKSLIPARAPVVGERIETELRTASGITDGKGHFVAGVVLITAGYSAEGKYSHYFLSQVPLKIGDSLLSAGQYLIGWTRGQDDLKVTFYEALTGKPVGTAQAMRNPETPHVEQFRVWPPREKPLIQLGRFSFPYLIADTDHTQ